MKYLNKLLFQTIAGNMIFKKKSIEVKDTNAVRKICLEATSIEDYFWQASQKGNNDRMWSINELMSTIALITNKFNIKTAVEFGTAQCRSSAALIFGGVETIYSVDIVKDEVVDYFKSLTFDKKIKWNFFCEDSRSFIVPNADLLLIDSMHNGEHLLEELDNAASKINKLILLHDTFTYGEKGDGGSGLNSAITNFIDKNQEWKKILEYQFNNGLTVLLRE